MKDKQFEDLKLNCIENLKTNKSNWEKALKNPSSAFFQSVQEFLTEFNGLNIDKAKGIKLAEELVKDLSGKVFDKYSFADLISLPKYSPLKDFTIRYSLAAFGVTQDDINAEAIKLGYLEGGGAKTGESPEYEYLAMELILDKILHKNIKIQENEVAEHFYNKL